MDSYTILLLCQCSCIIESLDPKVSIQSFYLTNLLSICTLFLTFSSLKFRVWWSGLLQATQAVKIKFEIDKKSSSNKKCRSTGSNAAKIVVLSSYLLVLIVPTLWLLWQSSLHRNGVYQFFVHSIHYSGQMENICELHWIELCFNTFLSGKKTGKMHLCALW